MTVKEFVDGYKKSNNIQNYFDSLLKEDIYIPYIKKISKCKAILDNTSYVLVGESQTRSYSQNTPIRHMLYSLTLIDSYFDIEVDFNPSNMIEGFDCLDSNGLIEELICRIPINEKKRWDMLLDSMISDIKENERSIVGYIENKIDLQNMIIKSLDVFKQIDE